MRSRRSSRFTLFRNSLRARVAMGVALPALVALSALSITNYWRERRLLEEQTQIAALQLGEVTLGSLQHAMLENDAQHMTKVIQDVTSMPNVERVQVLDLEGRVASDSLNVETGVTRQVQETGCRECHDLEANARPQMIQLDSPTDTLRINTPIRNEPECGSCHVNEDGHLGMLLLDVSLADSRTLILRDLRIDLAIALVSTLVITAGVFFLIHLLVVRRVEKFRQPLAALARGEFDQRPPQPSRPKDELDDLYVAFNHMAEELQRHSQEQAARSELRWRAIIEERERIAREIHDGVAQLMGYVNTKSAAVRLLIENRQLQDAKEQLKQLSDASSEAFIEVRADVLGLRTSTIKNGGLDSTLKEFATKFSELSGLIVELHLPGGKLDCMLSPESELHLLRITQEALTNVHKHAKCDRAWVHLACKDHGLELTIGDNGIGFDPDQPPSDRKPHFGLATMRERADAMGARFEVDSEPGAGTRVTVRLPAEK